MVESFRTIDKDDIALLEDTLLRFSAHARQQFEDIPIDVVDAVDRRDTAGPIDELRAMGVIAAPQTTPDDFAVWGGHVLRQGCDLSLTALGALASCNADLAARVHAQGIGCLALDGWGDWSDSTASPSVAAILTPGYGVLLDERTMPEGVRLIGGGAPHLLGSSPVVSAIDDPEYLVAFARHDGSGDLADRSQWEAIAVRSDAPGVRVARAGSRVGLRGAPQFEVSLDRVVVSQSATIATGARAARLALLVSAVDWLGCAAIAVGTARQAVQQARAYAVGRYQGGRQISSHAAVQLLLGEADHDLAVTSAVLRSRASEPLAAVGDRELLEWAISSRLAVGEHVHRAVNNAIQVHGGYGYMDDYGVSQRMRDVSALAVHHGSREQLLLLRQRNYASTDQER